MILVHETDLQKLEDFLDWWANSKKSMPGLNVVEATAKELKKRCEFARRGYPAGTLPREVETSSLQPDEKVTKKCEYPGCQNKTYGKFCFHHKGEGDGNRKAKTAKDI